MLRGLLWGKFPVNYAGISLIFGTVRDIKCCDFLAKSDDFSNRLGDLRYQKRLAINLLTFSCVGGY